MKHYLVALCAFAVFANVHAKITNVTTQAELDKIINNKQKPYTVVKFWKDECEPCEDLKPHFETAASKLGSKVNFVAVKGPSEITRNYRIGGFPKTFYFKNGKKMGKDGTRCVGRIQEDIKGAFGIR